MENNSVQQLKQYILSLRVCELQLLLNYVGKNKNGKKTELQARCLDLLKKGQISISLQSKIRELHKMRYTEAGFCNSNDTTSGTTVNNNNNNNNSNGISNNTNNNIHNYDYALRSSSVSNQVSHRTYSGVQTNQTLNPSQLVSSNLQYYSSMPRNLTSFTNTSNTQNNQASKLYNNGTNNHQTNYHASQHQVNNNHHNQYPATLKFKSSPFYEHYVELLNPQKLIPTASSRFQESNFSFVLTTKQADKISRSFVKEEKSYVYQIQLRFCLYDTNSEQEDNFPPSTCVKVNSKMCPLPNPIPTNKPGVEPKRPSRSVNITQLCRISPVTTNHISISWASEFDKTYAVAIFLVEKLSANQLLDKLKSKGIRNTEHTKAMIKENLAEDVDQDISAMSLHGSLLCPLGKMRIRVPCRSSTCSHIQCFDALLYLQMNEKKPSWTCPVCDKKAEYENLFIDGLFTEIINETAENCTEVQFNDDGTWQQVTVKKEKITDTILLSSAKRESTLTSPLSPPPAKKQLVDIITIDDSDDENVNENQNDETTKERVNGDGIENKGYDNLTTTSSQDNVTTNTRTSSTSSPSSISYYANSNNNNNNNNNCVNNTYTFRNYDSNLTFFEPYARYDYPGNVYQSSPNRMNISSASNSLLMQSLAFGQRDYIDPDIISID